MIKAIAALVILASATGVGIFHYSYENVLGTSLELKIQASSEAAAERARDAALDEIEREAKILSGYDASSEFSRWVATSGQPVEASSELREVLGVFDYWREKTGGALDASAESVTRVWKASAKAGRMPTKTELVDAVRVVRQSHWSIDASAGTVTHLSTAPIVLNSLAKSYIVGKAADAALGIPQVTGVVVNIGGDLAVRGNSTERVDIADPKSDAENATPIDSLQIRDRAVATSGNYRRGVEIGGRHYSHIVDPRTGQPAEEIISSTVVSANAAEAGALATAFSVMKPAESKTLAASRPGVEYLLIAQNGTRIESRGWKALTVPMARPFVPAAVAGTWDASMELTIKLELAHINDARARRPYVAVWIEDADKFPVRTLALWYEKPRWLPDLKAWYKDDRLRSMAEGSDISRSVSSATRPAGKYTLQWDGKDNAGKPVKAGKYRVMIEAAREHGTYQLLQEDLEFAAVPRQAELAGGVEIAAASLDYHKVAK